MSDKPTFVFIPGAWHTPNCYNKIITLLEDEHNLKCIPVTLPSTTDNPKATFKDDIDAARNAIMSETTQGRNVVVVSHSYGGMVGNSAIKGLAKSNPSDISSSTTTPTNPQASDHKTGYIKALILIASGFTITGVAFMDPLLGLPLPFFRVNKETGYAELTANPRELFYHDLPDDEADYWVGQLKTQSLKALYEGGEHAYSGWMDVPTWYIGTAEDRGLPVMAQRLQIGMVRAQGGIVHFTELNSSHSPFLSMPNEVVEVFLDAVRTVSGSDTQTGMSNASNKAKNIRLEKGEVPMVKLTAPGTWFRFGIPFLMGCFIGWGFVAFRGLRRFWRGR